jgi:hypothetical protein
VELIYNLTLYSRVILTAYGPKDPFLKRK